MRELVVRRQSLPGLLTGASWIKRAGVLAAPREPGLVRVHGEDGRILGWADWNPRSPIRGRLLLAGDAWPGDDAFLRGALDAAITRRMRLGLHPHGGCVRLVNGEGDGLPGLSIDVLGGRLLVGYHSRGMAERRELLRAMLGVALSDFALSEYVPPDAARRERIEATPPTPIEAEYAENGIVHRVRTTPGYGVEVDVAQRHNRRLVAGWGAGRRVLDLYAGSGAFALSCLAAGAASAIVIDEREEGIEAAAETAERNGFDLQGLVGEVTESMGELVELGPFDLVVIDPPAWAERRRDRTPALERYRALCLDCLRLVQPGSILFVASSSPFIDQRDLAKLMGDVAVAGRRTLQVLAQTGHPSDHPWPAALPTTRRYCAIAVLIS